MYEVQAQVTTEKDNLSQVLKEIDENKSKPPAGEESKDTSVLEEQIRKLETQLQAARATNEKNKEAAEKLKQCQEDLEALRSEMKSSLEKEAAEKKEMRENFEKQLE